MEKSGVRLLIMVGFLWRVDIFSLFGENFKGISHEDTYKLKMCRWMAGSVPPSNDENFESGSLARHYVCCIHSRIA
jgi:hypothetical protein